MQHIDSVSLQNLTFFEMLTSKQLCVQGKQEIVFMLKKNKNK